MITKEQIETERIRMHDYILLKLRKQDYHAVADAAMDLRELDAKLEIINEVATLTWNNGEAIK